MPDSPYSPLFVRLAKATRARLDAYSKENRMSRSAITEIALKRYLNEEAPLVERIERTKAR